jgi:hypothetical protein
MATSENQPKAAPDRSAADYQKAAQNAADKATGDKAGDKATGDKQATTGDRSATGARSETTARTASGDSVRGQRTGNRDQDPNSGIADELRESYERRTTVPGADNVDARLDNRVGDQRPKVEEWPAKPQQVDGPDVMGQAAFTRKHLQDRENKAAEDRKGMFSPGPHGLSDESLREGGPIGERQTLYGTESLTEGELKDSQSQGPKADG